MPIAEGGYHFFVLRLLGRRGVKGYVVSLGNVHLSLGVDAIASQTPCRGMQFWFRNLPLSLSVGD